jgi:hypothetical protein
MLEGMDRLLKVIQREGIFGSSEMRDAQKKAVKKSVSSLNLGFYLYYSSLDISQERIYFLIREEREKKLVSCVCGKVNDDEFMADETINIDGFSLKICPLTHENAMVIREVFRYTAPTVLGTEPAFGTGDRIGGEASATPGHIRAVRDYDVAAFFAQQSVRENERTKRTFQNVLDDVTWGVLQEGYKGKWGADADHLMDLASMGLAVDAGFTMFTVDPSHCINDAAVNMGKGELKREWAKLFRTRKEAGDFLEKYLSLKEELTNDNYKLPIRYNEEQIMRIAVQYLKAIRFTIDAYAVIARHKCDSDFDFEMSVDETSIATSALAHYLIARELNNAEVKLTSLAPRFDAGFEKGIDIRANDGKKPLPSDLRKFEDSIKKHSLIARKMGPYKLSVHSGSDKFTAYPLISKYTEGMFHLKTAGTSYLEAVKVIAQYDSSLFRKMHQCALATFGKNRLSYHLTTNLSNIPSIRELSQAEVVKELTINDDWRQVIHVAYGVLLDEFGKRMVNVLTENREDYYQSVAKHIRRHLEVFGVRKESL